MTASAEVLAAIPHRPPFLFVQRVVELGPKRIVTESSADPNADFFRGHYPGEPVMPGVLLCETCFQSGALLIAHIVGTEATQRGIPVLTRISDARFKHIVRPGDKLAIEVTLEEELDGAYFLTGRLSANGRHALRVSFACMLAASEQGR